MIKGSLKIFEADKLDENIRLEVDKVEKYLQGVLSNKTNYDVALNFLTIIAERFQELGIYSDIYYKIQYFKHKLIDETLSKDVSLACSDLNDIYLECIRKRDIYNAYRMLHYYKEKNPNDVSFYELCLAQLYVKLSQFELAESLFENCKKEQFENPSYIQNLVELEYKKKNYKKVVELLPILDKYVGRASFDSYFYVARAYHYLGLFDKEKEIYSIISSIIGNPVRFEKMLLSNIKQTEIDDTIERPTRRELYSFYKISHFDGNYQVAEKCLKKIKSRF